jgi:4'-phosphopantetheinyl transferase
MNRNTTAPDGDAATEKLLANMLFWDSSKIFDLAAARFIDDGSLDEGETSMLLSQSERTKLKALTDPLERRHFVMRRAFQRCYLKSVTGFGGPMSTFSIAHARDTAPSSLQYPALSISFSSSGPNAVAASSTKSKIGIDIEVLRPVANALELSRRFYHPSETKYLDAVPPDRREVEFLTLWTIKEACLKAIGKGVIYGLEKFIVSVNREKYTVTPPEEFGTSANWNVGIIEISPNCVTAVACYFAN